MTALRTKPSGESVTPVRPHAKEIVLLTGEVLWLAHLLNVNNALASVGKRFLRRSSLLKLQLCHLLHLLMHRSLE